MKHIVLLMICLLVMLAGPPRAQAQSAGSNPSIDSINTQFDWRTYDLKERFSTCAFPKNGSRPSNNFPKTIPGLKTLLQYDRGITDTLDISGTNQGRVTRWADQSGNGNDAYQYSPTLKPHMPYYHPARANGVYFNEGTYMELSKAVKSATIIMVLRSDSSTLSGLSDSKMILSGGGTQPIYYMSPTGTITSFDGVDLFYTSTTINQKVTTTMAPLDSHRVLMSWATSWSGAATQTWRLGASVSSPTTQYWSGRIFELAIYDRALTTAERDTMWGYLRDRYLLYNPCYDTLSYVVDQKGQYGRPSYLEVIAECPVGKPDTLAVFDEQITPVGGLYDTTRSKLDLVNLTTIASSLDSSVVLSAAAVTAGKAKLVQTTEGEWVYQARFAVYPTFLERWFIGKASGIADGRRGVVRLKFMWR